MGSIRDRTIACSRSFRLLAAALESGPVQHRSLIDPTSLEDEYGRFRVWSGNLGAQQKGHSSLDYRLRDSPLLQSNVLKLLHELENNSNEARAVVTGARLPYELQAARGDFSDDSASEDSEDDRESSDEDRPRFELRQRMSEIVDIINSLYRLSIRIRNPTIRIRSLKAATYRQIDPDTGVDVLTQYAEYDKRHVADSLAQLRAGFPQRKDEDVAFLVYRLSKAITKRRQQFKYWKKHRDKLANSSSAREDVTPIGEEQGLKPQLAANGLDSSVQAPNAIKFDLRAPPSEAQPRTLLSGTEATAHHRTLDDAVDSQSVTSVATTARDLGGHGIDLPPPPSSADGERDFECPYCYVICPARYARTRSWKTHILQDLQPYVCTYEHCPSEDQMFRSRREWLEHEASAHRKVWRCPGHPHAVYSSQVGIRSHLDHVHGGDLSETQIGQLISVAEASTNDLREYCPICFADANDPGVAGNLHNHIANHLEKFASFALPKFTGIEDDKSGASMDAFHGRGSSSDESEVASSHWSADTASGYDTGRLSSDYQGPDLEVTANDVIDHKVEPSQDAGHSELSASAVQSVPDATEDKVARFMEAAHASRSNHNAVRTEEVAVRDEGKRAFEIHSIDTSVGDDKEERVPSTNSDKPKEPRTIRISNLPAGDEANKRLFAFFETLDCQRFTLDPHVENRGYVTFDNQKNTEEALLSFDKTSFPGVELELEHGGENEMNKPTSGPGGVGVIFDVQGFLEALSRVLGESKHRNTISWAQDGKAFRILDEEAFSRDILPTFGFEIFSSFKDSLIACGFRQQVDQQYRVETGGLRRSSTWFHKHFQRHSPEVSGRTQFFSRLQDVFGGAKIGSLATQKITTEKDDDLQGSSRSAFPIKTASDIPSISQLYVNSELFVPDWLQNSLRASGDASLPLPKDEVNRKISMILHDITKLEVDAIVNATSQGLNVGASDSIGFRVHRAAGPELLQECRTIAECKMSQAVITDAYNLPCRKVIHTVRPHYFQAAQFVGGEDLLASCYWNCLKLAVSCGLKSIAFPCLSAGGFGFPIREAAEIALRTTRAFLDSGEGDSLEKIVFCVYRKTNKLVYRDMIPRFFPPTRTRLGQPNERGVRTEAPGPSPGESPVQGQDEVSDTENETAESSKPKRPTASRLSESVESLSRLTGGPTGTLWACCKCRARPMETPNCLVCYHELCNTCEGESTNGKNPNLFLVDLHPSPNLLEEFQGSSLSPLDRRGLMKIEKQARASVRSRPNSPTQSHHPTYVKAHRKHLSLDTLFYYDLPFQFDSAANQDYIIVTRELNEEQTETLFEHSHQHRRNLPSLIRTRTHPDPLDSQQMIRIGSDPSFNSQQRPATGARPIFLPGPFAAADHCAFSIDPRTRRWLVSVTKQGVRASLNGRWIYPLKTVSDGMEVPTHGSALPEEHNGDGFFVKSGDILGIGDNDFDMKPVHIFRLELDGLGGAGEDALWEEAEARASRYGFATIGLDEDDNNTSDDDEGDIDLDISAGYRIINAAAQVPEAARGSTSARWTRLDRRLVNRDALNEAGLPFENRVKYLLVFRELARAEVQRLAARTREGRAVKAATEFTRKERRRKERRVKDQKKEARERKNTRTGGGAVF